MPGQTRGSGVLTRPGPGPFSEHPPGTVERWCETCGGLEYSAGGLGLDCLLRRASDCYVAAHRVTVRSLP